MEEIQNKIVKVTEGNSSLAITKGYHYTNKDGKERYTYNDTYYTNGTDTYRKHENDKGINFYKVDLIDVVVEEFPMKDGVMGSKTYPLSEVPYLAFDVDDANEEVLSNYLKFKLHR